MRLLKIGRDVGCDIIISSPRVSSLHAELTLLNSGDILLEDKGSLNGTYVQNKRIQPGKSVSIRRGDAVRFGDVELQWSQVPIEDNSGYRAVWGIGCDFRNDFQVAGATVSRFHATVKQSNENKFYIIDHSKNGTTVDGRKIVPNKPQRIKKGSAISCGGVPVDLRYGNKIPWGTDVWKILLASVASLLIIVFILYGLHHIIPEPEPLTVIDPITKDTIFIKDGDTICVRPYVQPTYTWTEIYGKYNHSVVMLKCFYHLEVIVPGWSDEFYELMTRFFGIPRKFLVEGSQLKNISGLSDESLFQAINSLDKENLSSATGFFISENGELITNLHVVKPWLFDNSISTATSIVKEIFAAKSDELKEYGLSPKFLAGMSELSVEGKLDYLSLIPQGDTFDESTLIKCRVVSAGNDIQKDVALVQIITKRLPFSDCTFVDLSSNLELSEDSVYIGCPVFAMGFPLGNAMQQEAKENGIKVVSQDGKISQNLEFDFMHNASTTGGMSGSPIFNNHGKLIGVHHAGYSQAGLQGFNYGVKAKYVKELLDNPHTK